MQASDSQFPDIRRSMWGGIFVGIGVMAAIDTIIFHQLLAWHHFYDRSTPLVGLMSDGVLHAAELIAIVAGFFILLDLRHLNALSPAWGWSGFFLGAGGFQIFDGIINHKVLRLHQIRYGVNVVPYDVAWNLFGIALVLIGVSLAMRARSRSHTSATART